MPLVLASASPRRQALIRLIDDDVVCCPAALDEQVPPGTKAADVPLLLARQKARAVAPQFPDRTVLGCDTVVVLDGRVLGKPVDRADARAMLRALSGRTHAVLTGCCLRRGAREASFCAETRVTFYPLTDAEIAAYVATGEADDKAGAYGIQERAALFVREIQGDYNNVVGLPVARLARELAAFEAQF